MSSAAARGWCQCHGCGLLSRLAGRQSACCPRCGVELHIRRAPGPQRCWALLLAAAICYLPANLLPIMVTSSVMGTQRDTILSGVAYLWSEGSWALALVVLAASVVVPLMKILVLLLLVVSVQWRWRWAPLQRARLFRLVEAVGPWSMLDIFVVALLVALVQWQGLATIRPGLGAGAFGLVVVLTMLAAMCFDPRWIWDAADGEVRTNEPGSRRV
ncbi:paraquat-inducible membrane protein A [Chromobacterium sp. ATCC 53434]|uniref:paraquat-inducible protein A n=1 Tax=Chromobacterium TaxID=535 RepID=UPI000C77E10D|nr:paraquat-inducible protein A [Chromobacterium sp. ATCC 53434]AUH51012.1 paraquat-inducible membrane protein A [Chromobacterium sp. ATCC 53434]